MFPLPPFLFLFSLTLGGLLKMMLPNTRSLFVFEVVIRLGSFSKAAEELHVSQPAISYQIKVLEDYFNVRLVERSSSRVIPTQEGSLLYKGLSESIQLMRLSVGQLRSHIAGQAIGVSVRSHFAYKWLSPHLSKANFNFDIRFLHSNEKADFSNSDIHISIEWLHSSEVPKDALFLLPGNLTPACHPDLLKGVKNSHDPAILRNSVLLQENDSKTWNEWLAKAGYSDLKPLSNIYYSDTNVRQQAAVEKQGFALIAPKLMADEIAKGLLVCPFNLYLNSFSYYLRISPEQKENSKVREFVQWITEQIKLTECT